MIQPARIDPPGCQCETCADLGGLTLPLDRCDRNLIADLLAGWIDNGTHMTRDAIGCYASRANLPGDREYVKA